MRKLWYIPLLALMCWGMLWAATEQITDGGLENWNSATDLVSWTEAIAGTSTVNRDGSNQRSGTYCCRMDVDASNSTARIYQDFTMTPSAAQVLEVYYYMSAASKTAKVTLRDSGSNVFLQDDLTSWGGSNNIVIPNELAYALFTASFNAHASYTNYRILIERNSPSASVYWDDISIQEGAASSFIPKVMVVIR